MKSQKNAGKLFIVSAPSGAGKTTLVNALIETMAGRHCLNRLITYTTKEPRSTEKHGVDYHFISTKEFESKIAEGFFLEWSTTYGAYYGTSKNLKEHLEMGTSFIAVVDRLGAQRLLGHIPHAVLIWIYTQDLLVLEERLKTRGTEKLEEIERRLLRAKIEIAQEKEESIYNYHILNDFFEKALKDLEKVIISHLR